MREVEDPAAQLNKERLLKLPVATAQLQPGSDQRETSSDIAAATADV